MPTGIALQDPRATLFAAAERVLLRDGVGGLTSRAVTEEAGVAKGVLHRHFVDFDDFLAELIRDHIALLGLESSWLHESVGRGSLVSNLADALMRTFTPTALGLIAVAGSRNDVRARLRVSTPSGIPILTESTAMVASYLRAERQLGRLTPQADTERLAFALIGTGHLLFAGELGGLPDDDAVEEVVESIIVGAEPGLRP